MAIIIDRKQIEKLERRKRAKKAKVQKPPAKAERNFQKEIEARRAAIIGPIIEDLKIMIERKASPSEIAIYLEDALRNAEIHVNHSVNGIIDIWKSEMDELTREQFTRSLTQTLGVDITAVLDEPRIKEALELGGREAANLIVNMPGEFIDGVAKAVADNFRGTPLPEGRTLFDQIMHLGDVSKSRAKLIARDQTTKMQGLLNKERQQEIGVTMYVWRTMKDRRVVGNPAGFYPKGTRLHRKHYLMEGKYCRWDDATVYSDDEGKTWKKRTPDMPHVHPGVDIQCRCIAEAVIDIDQIIKYANAA